MVRWLILSVLIVAATAGAILYAPTVERSFPNKPVEVQGPQPIVTVKEGSLSHDFGVMSQLSVGRRQWTLRNDGDADLVLRLLTSTCKCTIADLGKDPETGETKTATVKPGKEKIITLQWDTKEVTGKFEQSATIGTNDLERPELTFVAKGEVQPAILSMPSDLRRDLGSDISNDEGTSAFWAFQSPDRPDFSIEVLSNSQPDLIGTSVKNLTAEECKTLGVARGKRLDVKIKPSGRIGKFREELILKTDHPKRPELRVYVQGRLVGPVSLNPATLFDHQIRRDRGATLSTILSVRGQETTRFEVVSKPESVQVRFEPIRRSSRTRSAGAKFRQYRLILTVPPGMRSGPIEDFLMIKTDHPRAERLKIPIDLIILG